jgi:hypothetical protein
VIVEGEPASEIARAVRDYDVDLVTVRDAAPSRLGAGFVWIDG